MQIQVPKNQASTPTRKDGKRFVLSLILLLLLALSTQTNAGLKWLRHESRNFIVVYLEPHAYLVPHIVGAAESALTRLETTFNFKPSEKIVILTHDFSDYGSAGATAIPHNLIRLEIEPLEPGYENIPYTDRIQWLLAHELVHILVTDQGSSFESFARTLFSKVPPEKEQPLSIFYSLLTNSVRYTPRWHQEGIAVFLETWLSGGFGRVLGNFDEMYFRSMVLEKKSHPGPYELEASHLQNSFLLLTQSYLYGARFSAFLAAAFGVEKLLSWYDREEDGFYGSFDDKFKSIFGLDLHRAWRLFIRTEQRFQKRNLEILSQETVTPLDRLTGPLGWVTQPHYDDETGRVVFGSHQAHSLTAINQISLRKPTFRKIGSLPTPSIVGIASTAYDKKLKRYFYTTNNNQLYRDLWAINLISSKKIRLIQNIRVGALTVCPETHELWGVRHAAGKAMLVYGTPPYKSLKPLVEFEFGDVLHDLAISPSGRSLAATLHRADGQQSIIIADAARLKETSKFTYTTISPDGSPEFPTWSADERSLYWSAYTNGVSNIYRYDSESKEILAMSHSLRGLFRPIYVDEHSLFAFEFSSAGFIPVLLRNRPAVRLPAIHYFGQQVVERNPEVTNLNLPALTNGTSLKAVRQRRYSGLANMKLNSFFPVISGFQGQKVVGFYSQFSDPLYAHDLSLEFGISPFQRIVNQPDFHLKAKYEFNQKLSLSADHNAQNFFDLVNDRKFGLIGSKLALGYTYYWKFDNPHKIKQTTELTYFTGVKAINDNVIAVLNPDFFIFESTLNSKSVRRAIGSVDTESGHDFNLTALGFASRLQNPQMAAGLTIDWTGFATWAWPHNIFLLKLGGGYLYNPDKLAIGQFYFGGFGNRTLDDKPVKQYRELLRFPGLPIYSLRTDRFAKLMLENALPPIKVGKLRLWKHFLSHVDASVFTQGLATRLDRDNIWVNLGGQVNLIFNHWFNLESTISFGMARSFNRSGHTTAKFISLKLLRD